jgi:hypothetical protein
MKSLCALVGALALMMSLAVSANERIARAANALKSGDYTTAAQIAVPLSEAGNADAQLLVGIMYFGGLGFPENQSKAYDMYTLAAAQSQPAAMHNLASMHYRGEGVTINFAKARNLNRQAAELGLTIAQHDYAAMLLAGIGGSADRNKAAYWFKKSADGGYPRAAFRFGVLMSEGPNADQNISVRYLCRALKLGSEEAARALVSQRNLCR